MVDYHIMLLLISLFVVSGRGHALAKYLILLGERQSPPRQCSVFFLLLLRKALERTDCPPPPLLTSDETNSKRDLLPIVAFQRTVQVSTLQSCK